MFLVTFAGTLSGQQDQEDTTQVEAQGSGCKVQVLLEYLGPSSLPKLLVRLVAPQCQLAEPREMPQSQPFWELPAAIQRGV